MMSVPERLATIRAKGGVRQALRTHIADELVDCEAAAGLIGLNTQVPQEWYDTANNESLIDYLSAKSHVACQSVYQPTRSRLVQKVSGGATESTEYRELDLEVTTAHLHYSWSAGLTFYGKEIATIEEALAARTDVYNGAVKRVLRQRAKRLSAGAIDRIEVLSDNTTINPPTDRRGFIAFATVRIRITQEVIVQHCISS